MILSTKQKTILVALTITVLVIGIIAVVLAATVYAPSNTVTVTVSPTPSPSPSPTPVGTVLTSSLSTIIIGNQITLTATMDHAYAGITVNFYENSVSPANLLTGGIATTTNSAGVATYTFTPSTVGDHIYIAQPQGTLP